MAEEKKGASLPLLDNVRDYTYLYNYVKAYLDITVKDGEFYEAIKEADPQFESKYDLSKVSGRIAVAEKYQNVLGLAGVNKKKLRQLHEYACQIKSPFPSVADIDNEKAKYDTFMHKRDVDTAQKVKEDKEALRLARKENGKKRWKMAGAFVAAVAGTVLTGGVLGGFGLGVYGLVANAVTLGAGITSGLAVGGLVIGVVGGRFLFRAASNMFSKISKLVRESIAEHKATRQKVREQRKSLRRSKAQRRMAERAVSFDRAYTAVPYPGSELFNANEYDNKAGVDLENMGVLSEEQARALGGGQPAKQNAPANTPTTPTQGKSQTQGKEGEASSTATGKEEEVGLGGDGAGQSVPPSGSNSGEPTKTKGKKQEGSSAEKGNGDKSSDPRTQAPPKKEEEELDNLETLKPIELYNKFVELNNEAKELYIGLEGMQKGSLEIEEQEKIIKSLLGRSDKYLEKLGEGLISSEPKLKKKIEENSDFVRFFEGPEGNIVAAMREFEDECNQATPEALKEARQHLENKLVDLEGEIKAEKPIRTIAEFMALVEERNSHEQALAMVEAREASNEAYEDAKWGPYGKALRERIEGASDAAIRSYQETDSKSLKAIIDSVMKASADGQSVLTATGPSNLTAASDVVGMANMLQAYAEEIMQERAEIKAMNTDDLFEKRNKEWKAMHDSAKEKSAWEAKKRASGRKELSEEEQRQEQTIYRDAEKHEVQYATLQEALKDRDVTQKVQETLSKNEALLDDRAYKVQHAKQAEEARAMMKIESANSVGLRISQKEQEQKAIQAKLKTPKGLSVGECEQLFIEEAYIKKDIKEYEKVKAQKVEEEKAQAKRLAEEAAKQAQTEQAKKDRLRKALSSDVLKNAFVRNFKAGDEKGKVVDNIIGARQSMVDEQLAVLKSVEQSGEIKKDEYSPELVADVVDEYIDATKEFKGKWKASLVEAHKAEADRIAKEEADRKADEIRKAQEAERKAEEDRKAKEAARKADEARKAQEEAERKAEEDRKAKEAARKAEEARKAKEEAERKVKEENAPKTNAPKANEPQKPNGPRMTIAENEFEYHYGDGTFVVPADKMKKVDDEIALLRSKGWKEGDIINRLAGDFKNEFRHKGDKKRVVQGEKKFRQIVKSFDERQAYLVELEAQNPNGPLLKQYNKQEEVEEKKPQVKGTKAQNAPVEENKGEPQAKTAQGDKVQSRVDESKETPVAGKKEPIEAQANKEQGASKVEGETKQESGSKPTAKTVSSQEQAKQTPVGNEAKITPKMQDMIDNLNEIYENGGKVENLAELLVKEGISDINQIQYISGVHTTLEAKAKAKAVSISSEADIAMASEEPIEKGGRKKMSPKAVYTGVQLRERIAEGTFLTPKQLAEFIESQNLSAEELAQMNDYMNALKLDEAQKAILKGVQNELKRKDTQVVEEEPEA